MLTYENQNVRLICSQFFTFTTMERLLTPATPNQYDNENDDDPGFRCVGKSMTFQSKSQLFTPSIRSWLRSPNLNTKRKNASPRPPETSGDGKQNSSTNGDARRAKEAENTTLPAIVAKGNAKGASSRCCKRPRKEVEKQRKKDGSKIRHNLPKMGTRQQSKLGWLQSELPYIIMAGKIKFKIDII